MEDIILVGYGGHAKSVADCIERMGKYNIVGYTDKIQQSSVYTYLGTDEVLKEYYDKGIHNAVICIGYLGKGNVRETIYQNLKEMGFSFPVIIDPSAIVSNSAVLGEGTFVGKQAVVNACVKVGKMCIVNTGAIIEHDCVVGDFVHIAVAAVICGEVNVGKNAFLGANSVVIQCKTIEEKQIVPAGVVVR